MKLLTNFYWNSAFALAFCWCCWSGTWVTVTTAQPNDEFFDYLDAPVLLWQNVTTDSGDLGVQIGNGLYMSPDKDMLVSTSFDGTVRAFEPYTGEILWTYTPNSLGLPIRCFSGVTFSVNGPRPYIVYAIADGADDAFFNPDAETRVIALDMDDGQEIFQSTSLPGVAAGTPVTDFVGDHILLTHNVAGETGYLSILFVGLLDPGNPLMPVFQDGFEDTEDNDTIVEKPFSPMGVFHNPAEGYYEGGQDNTNDMFLFCWDTPRSATNVGDTDGRLFGVQFPTNYTGDGQGLSFFPLGGRMEFQSSNAPVLTNAGRSYYWSVTKSSQYAVYGADALPRWWFDRLRFTGRVTNLARDSSIPYLAARASPTLSSDPAQPTVFGVGANTQLWRLPFDYNTNNQVVVDTPDIVSAKVLLTPREDNVLYGTQAVATAGSLHMVSSDNLQTEVWSLAFPGGVIGDMALDRDGTIVYAANPAGEIFAYQFAMDNTPSEMPTVAPTNSAPTLTPTTAAPVTPPPTGMPTGAPSDTPSSGPTGMPTTAAPTMSAMPTTLTAAPTVTPTALPTANPTTPAPVTPVPVTPFPTPFLPELTPMPTQPEPEDSTSAGFAAKTSVMTMLVSLLLLLTGAVAVGE